MSTRIRAMTRDALVRERAWVAVFIAVGLGFGFGLFLVSRGYALALDLVGVAAVGGSAGVVWLQLVAQRRPHPALLILTLLGTLMQLATIHPYPIGAIVAATVLGAGVFAAFMLERPRTARVATVALCMLLIYTKAQAVL